MNKYQMAGEVDRAAPVVVGLGEILWDLLPEGKQLGGAPTNFAYHAHALGAEAWVASAVGDDEPGREIIETLDALALTSEGVAVLPNLPTGSVSISLDDGGQPSYTIHEGVAWDSIPWTPLLAHLASRAEAVCFGSLAQRSRISRAVISAFLDATPPDCLRVFDINLRQQFFSKEIIEESLARASMLKLNDEELPVLAELLELSGSTEEALASELNGRFDLRLVALTRGAKGSTLYALDETFERSGEAVSVADTVGAGDSFTAALTIGLLSESTLQVVHEQASRLAAFVCTKSGGTPSLPDEFRQTAD